jgi:hypothetical protein
LTKRTFFQTIGAGISALRLVVGGLAAAPQRLQNSSAQKFEPNRRGKLGYGGMAGKRQIAARFGSLDERLDWPICRLRLSGRFQRQAVVQMIAPGDRPPSAAGRLLSLGKDVVPFRKANA